MRHSRLPGYFHPDLLHSFTNALSHRGPDDSGDWYSARAQVGLAHRRLSIIDVSPLGHQPMEDAARTAVIVFNGEIYNFRELRADLERSGHSFRGHSDTEVLLALYEAKGEAMLSLLNGIFAFAIWDDAARSLLLACDAMAVKPLYFAQTAEGFLFASELKALMCTGSDPGNTRRRVAVSHAGIPLESWRSDADPRCSAARSRRGSPRQGLPHRPPVDLGAFDVACGTDRRWRRTKRRGVSSNRCGPPSIARWWPTCRLAPSCPVASIRARWSPWPAKRRRRLSASRSTREACAIAEWRMTCRMHDRLRATSV